MWLPTNSGNRSGSCSENCGFPVVLLRSWDVIPRMKFRIPRMEFRIPRIAPRMAFSLRERFSWNWGGPQASEQSILELLLLIFQCLWLCIMFTLTQAVPSLSCPWPRLLMERERGGTQNQSLEDKMGGRERERERYIYIYIYIYIYARALAFWTRFGPLDLYLGLVLSLNPPSPT